MSSSRPARLRVPVGLALALAIGALLVPNQGPAAAATAAPDCGPTLAKAGAGAWRCTFSDDFDGSTLDPTKWIAQQTSLSGFTAGKDCFVDSPNNVSVADGELSLTVRRESAPFYCSKPGGGFVTDVTAASVSTYNRFSQAYGRFEVRAAFPGVKVAGVHAALWLWPTVVTEAWPGSGEIDLAEFYSRYPDRAIPYLHYLTWWYDPNVTNNNCLIDDPSAYHTYVLEWSASTIEIKYDGKTCLRNTSWTPVGHWKPYPFNSPFMVALTQGLGSTGNDYAAGSTPLPATTKVDYVRVWS
ncbi:MAG: family 16 glycosylhydrolase [Marmoricola sp.]